MEITTCTKCNGTGSVPPITVFLNFGEAGPVGSICDECGGTGMIYPRFFVQFYFNSELSGRSYWLPVFFNAENVISALQSVKAFNKGLESHFKHVHYTYPMPENEMTKPEIKDIFKQNTAKKFARLDARVWAINDISNNIDWSFDEHLKYVAENLPLSNRVVAECREQKRFPVRIIREGERPIDFDEFLLVDIIRPTKAVNA